MAFPVSPSNGATYTTGGKTYVYNSTKGVWAVTGTANPAVPTVVTTNGGQTISGTLSVTGTLTANLTGNVTGSATTAGTVTTAAQPNITSLGTLASLAVTGNANANIMNDSKGDVRAVPQVTKTTAFVLTAAEAGKHVSTNANVTVPNGVFSIGDSVTILNNSAASITIIQGASVTMYQVGTSNTGNRTLAQKGLATVFCYAANTFVITGGGMT